MKRPSLTLSLVRRALITLVAFAIIAPAMFNDAPLVAQEEAAVEEATEEADAKPAADEDLFKVPEGDAKALQAYMKKLANTPPEGEREDEQIEFSTKALNSLVIAADRLLAAKPNETQTKQAHGYRIQALQALAVLGQEGAREKFEKAMKEARESKIEDVVGMGWQTLIEDRVGRNGRWDEMDPKEKQAFHDEIIAKVKADGPQEIDVSIVQAASLPLDQRGDVEFAAKLLDEANPLLAKSEDQAVKTAFTEANLEGMLRRLKLPGNQIEITGELLSGGKVDWESYRGKVVLVDFWATWCGPCRDEVPNILAMYEAYHDKGFEVLGVSLDETPEDAKKYKAEMKLPWDSLFPMNEAEREWSNPLVKHYGIGGIPTAILVDKDGKVVHMNARGENLPEELQRLLGDPVEKKPAAEKPEAEKAS
ncbi:MAG: TlpA family protein disulfide reductase [Pirellulales bacterium]|nr:TlpA family protein disulfide reductase [Pirellulales bacterium]